MASEKKVLVYFIHGTVIPLPSAVDFLPGGVLLKQAMHFGASCTASKNEFSGISTHGV